MSSASEKTRRQAHLFIYNHPLRDEFLAWMDEHEDVVDDLKLVVEDIASGSDDPVRAAVLIRRLRADFDDVRKEWAPLLAHLLVWEFPELRNHLKRDLPRFGWLGTPQSERSGSNHREPEECGDDGGETT